MVAVKFVGLFVIMFLSLSPLPLFYPLSSPSSSLSLPLPSSLSLPLPSSPLSSPSSFPLLTMQQ